MSTLLIKFGITLEDHGLGHPSPNHGPLFHRWLPDGEKDALVLNTGEPPARLKLWCERRGFLDGRFIRFDYERQEIDPGSMSKQGVLDAGPLKGMLEIDGVSEEVLTALREQKTGDKHYIALGKRLVKLIYPPVARLIAILRTNYGQYWIRELEKWDSRKRSLGGYCKTILHLKWSLDGRITWSPFLPNEPIGHEYMTVEMGRTIFCEYLTESDWHELGNLLETDYNPSPAAFILARTHQLKDQGDLKYALIEGVTALEVATAEFIRRIAPHSGPMLKWSFDNGRTWVPFKDLSAFFNLSLPERVTIVVASLGTISEQDMEDTLRAIELRNEVIDKGGAPPEEAERKLSKLLKVVGLLIAGPRFKFPGALPPNSIMSQDQWEEIYAKC